MLIVCAVAFLLLNLVYGDDNVKDKIKSLEDKLIAFEAECKDRFDKVDNKIEAVRSELSSEIKEVRNELSSKIDSAIKPLYWIFGFVSTFAVSAVIGLFIHYLSNK
ncbi:hypothetical protein DB313_05355 (plasmid) [Borrelia turcica IST7]|uniref:DUF1640 domain-containing protein n=1 Tax=Borrelia turcica IST7 TaxID=1104446 RepID=A0A386PQA5_9SPIR|nr:hypothetical protein [Borrelia turcica]AYE36927.1 hypothetical protein DB313_05355 [Borrelia turcica IST7]